MTAACLYLLGGITCPVWPWVNDQHGLLIEAFPAAQLKHWNLPFQRYDGSEQVAVSNREKIVSGLEERRLSAGVFKAVLLSSADALDSVLCALAAKAVSDARLLNPPALVDDEGAIAVHV